MFLTFRQFIESDQSHNVKMSEEEFKKFELRIQRAKVQIYKRFPFFYLVLQRLKTVPTVSIPTMAVDNNGNIYINPNFTMNELSFEETIGVLVHEAFHHVNLTFYRGKGKDPHLWNVATDYIMNRDILEMGAALPALALLPHKSGDKWIITQLGNLDITEMTSEQLYIELLSKQDKFKKALEKLFKEQEKFDKHLDPSKSQSNGQGESGEPEDGESGEPKGSESSGDGTPTPMDVPSDEDVYKPNDGIDPTTGRPMSDDEKAARTKSDIAKIAEEVKRNQTGIGNNQIPRSFDVNKLLAPTVNWRALLKNFIGKSTKLNYNWNRLSRRSISSLKTSNKYFLPKIRTVLDETVLDMVVAVDTSSSIPEKTVHTFIKSVINITKQFKTTMLVLFYNDKVYAELKIDETKTESQIISELLKIRLSGGGNNEPDIKRYLTKNKVNNINGFILFTDGYIQSAPDFPKAKNYLFLIVQGGDDKILKKFGPTHNIDITT